MHRDEPICRARTPLRGLPHILQSMSRSCRASWRCDWQVPTPGSAGWAGEVHSGKLTPVCRSDGGWGFEGKCRCCPLSDLRRHGAYWSLVSVSSKSGFTANNVQMSWAWFSQKDSHDRYWTVLFCSEFYYTKILCPHSCSRAKFSIYFTARHLDVRQCRQTNNDKSCTLC